MPNDEIMIFKGVKYKKVYDKSANDEGCFHCCFHSKDKHDLTCYRPSNIFNCIAECELCHFEEVK